MPGFRLQERQAHPQPHSMGRFYSGPRLGQI